MGDVLRVHFEDGTFRDMPPDTYCTATEAGILFQDQSGRLEAWFRPGLIKFIDRVPATNGVTILAPTV